MESKPNPKEPPPPLFGPSEATPATAASEEFDDAKKADRAQTPRAKAAPPPRHAAPQSALGKAATPQQLDPFRGLRMDDGAAPSRVEPSPADGDKREPDAPRKPPRVTVVAHPRVVMRRVDELHEHPDAAIVPDLSSEDYARLLEDIRARGIVTYLEILEDGTVLDGRHRLRAARELGLEKVPCLVVKLNADEHPVERMIVVALLRRHLATSQRAALAAELDTYAASRTAAKERQVATQFGKPQRKAGDTVPANLPEPPAGESRAALAKLAKVSPRTAQTVSTLRTKAPDLFQDIKAGTKTAHAAQQEYKRRLGVPAGPSKPMADGTPAAPRDVRSGQQAGSDEERSADRPATDGPPPRATNAPWAMNFVEQVGAVTAWAWKAREWFKTDLTASERRSFASGLRKLAKSFNRLAEALMPGVRPATKGHAESADGRPRARAKKPSASRRPS
jgi:hypothetical protein